MKYTLIADAADSGRRLDIFLSDKIEDLSRSRAKTIIEKGGVTVDGNSVIKASFALKGTETVEADAGEPINLEAFPQDIPVHIIYQDTDLAVIDKKQGMVTHPATGSPSGTLVNALLFHIKDLSTINGVIRPGIVHRLDKDTSGLLVIAKNDAAHNSLARQISEKSAKRYYIALVDGNIKEESGIIEKPIDRSKTDRKKMAVREDGRVAKTSYRVLERFGSYTLTEFELYTGRTHQIRVHAAYLHHPVTGDRVYGGSNKFGLNGQLLHAYKLEFTHPSTSERLVFRADLPDYFKNVLKKLNSNIKLLQSF